MTTNLKYDISVQTLIYRSDDSLFTDLGTMKWFGVNGEIVNWLAGSCKTTASWLLALPEATDPESYTVKYRTIVYHSETGKVKSDTTLIPFEKMTYSDVIRFERWALDQLDELVSLFEAQHKKSPESTQHRNKTKTIGKILLKSISNKFNKRED